MRLAQASSSPALGRLADENPAAAGRVAGPFASYGPVIEIE